MSTSTKATTVAPKATVHLNKMNGMSFDVNCPITKLRMMGASCFFGEPAYYEKGASKAVNSTSVRNMGELDKLADILKGIIPFTALAGETTASAMEKAIDAALDHDVEATLQVAVSLRHEDHIRTTPQVILVRAANHAASKGTGLIRKYAQGIISRGDEPAVQLAYQIRAFGKTVPNSLKRAWNDYLSNLPEHQLAKYRMENKTVKTIDVVRLSHAKSDAIAKLVKDELKLTKTGGTWESIISAKGASKDTWLEAIEVMGHMALLRNMRNFEKHGVPVSAFEQKFLAGVLNGKQLPFRYYAAYSNVASLDFKAVIEKAMNISVDNLPKLSGKVASLCDNSGSAHGTMTSSAGTVRVSEIANLTAVLTGMVSDEGTVKPFGDRLMDYKVDKTKGVLEQAKKVNQIAEKVGMGTETGVWLFWDEAIKNKEHFDHVFIYSDMQAGHGGLYTRGKVPNKFAWGGASSYSTHIHVPALVAEYREKVNPDVQVYMVQVAGYGDSIMPEIYDKTYILGGWSDSILKFADKVTKITNEGK